MTNKPQLTIREKEVGLAIAKGLTNKEIAMLLGIALFTVKNHVVAILQKLGVCCRLQIADYINRQNPDPEEPDGPSGI